MRADYVIVGAGSAGCAMAYRLSEAGKSVIIVEFGGTDAGPFIQMPAALSYPMNMKRYDWGYYSEPEPYLGGRRIATPRGKVIGGSSSINGMVYVRGHPLDYEFWSESGASGWRFADVLPYFKRMECWHDGGHGGEQSWRGSTGPLHISRGPRKNPLTKAFVEAGHQAGYPLTADYNGSQQEGFGPFDATIWNGRRWSAATAYLRPALKRDNCHLIHGLAERVIIEHGRAVGIKILRGKKSDSIFANKEVILAASSINSPKILMLSGIGPAKHLAEHDIPIVANRPGVGQNLQDHLEIYIQVEAIQPVSLSKYWNVVMKGLIGTQWLLTKKGVGASNQFESAAFIRSEAGIEYPDIQYHFLPIAMQYDGSNASVGHSFQAHVGPMRSPSRGFVKLNSNNPIHDPKIQFNYMSHEKDWKDFRNCIRLTREIFAQKAFKPFVGKEIQPSADCQSDDELDDFTRNNVESAYHPCGTCKMGAKNDPMSVVDPKCSVIGVERLRVADSSIFPRITNGNLNAPSIMIGEKAADHILQRVPLPAENSEPWIHPSWKTDQR